MSRAAFESALTTAYAELFASDPEYAYSAARVTPAQLAAKMIGDGPGFGGSISGLGVKRAAKACGIKPTYKAINAYLLQSSGEHITMSGETHTSERAPLESVVLS